MAEIEDVAQKVEAAEQAEGDRYSLLEDIHDRLREALAETDGDAPAAGR